MSHETDYIDITPASLAVHCVERAAMEVHESLNGNPMRWWFAITDIDQALGAALVGALSGTAGVGALTRQLQKQWFEYFEDSRDDSSVQPPMSSRLAPFCVLLDRAQDAANSHAMGGTLSIATEDENDIQRLHNFRNDLLHVKPISWSLQIAGLPRMVGAVAMTLKQLFEMAPLVLHLEDDETQRVREAIIKILIITGRVEGKY